jgi:hypothetical protein
MTLTELQAHVHWLEQRLKTEQPSDDPTDKTHCYLVSAYDLALAHYRRRCLAEL